MQIPLCDFDADCKEISVRCIRVVRFSRVCANSTDLHVCAYGGKIRATKKACAKYVHVLPENVTSEFCLFLLRVRSYQISMHIPIVRQTYQIKPLSCANLITTQAWQKHAVPFGC